MNQKTAMQNRDLEAVFHPMTDMSRLNNDGPLMVPYVSLIPLGSPHVKGPKRPDTHKLAWK